MGFSVTDSATSLAADIAAKKMTAVDVMQASFDQVDRLGPSLNAVIWQDRDAAMAEARACDADLARGHLRGPLHGLPITIKESFDLAGSPTTWGIPEWADTIANTDSDVAKRYKAAGGIIYGKTNVPLKLVEWQSFNEIYGSTSNPWDLTRTSGGSSGGSAVAIATGMSALEVGSDIGSSIRNPAHYNGVFGLKPTWSTVSSEGHKPGDTLIETDIAVCGPIARTAADLSLAYDVLAGPSRFEAAQFQLRHIPDPRTRLSQFRVAIKLGDPAVPVDTAYLDAISAFGDDLEAAGATVIRDRTPDIDGDAQFTLYLNMLGAAMSRGMSDEDVETMLAPFRDAPADVQRIGGNRYKGMALSHRDWLELDNKRRVARLAFDAFFEQVDVLITPVASSAAFVKDEDGFRPFRRFELNGKQELETNNLFWSGYSGTALIPSVVGPMAQIGGLPVGYQAICGHGRDLTCLAFARAAEREIMPYTPPPCAL